MRKTYAYNSIVIGVLVGIIVFLSTGSVVLTALAALGISVVGFIMIRGLEKLLEKGVDKATEKIGKAHERRKEAKAAAAAYDAGAFVTRQETTRFPAGSAPEGGAFAARQRTTTFPAASAFPAGSPESSASSESTAEHPANGAKAKVFCRFCGSEMKPEAMFCMYCGSPSDKLRRNS